MVLCDVGSLSRRTLMPPPLASDVTRVGVLPGAYAPGTESVVMSFWSEVAGSPFVTLFLIIAIGVTIGSVRVGGVTLGAAGVFFVALVMGHWKWTLPGEITELGLVLFVYAVGLQAGSRFFSILHGRGLAFLMVGVAATFGGALVTVGLAKWLGFSSSLAAGVYAGATTCTPALAALLDAVQRQIPDDVHLATVGYGATYPFSVVAVVVAIQLLPRILRTSAADAALQYRTEELAKTPPLEEGVFRITNPNCADRTVESIQELHVSQSVICRIKQHGVMQSAKPELVVGLGDVVKAVGTRAELLKLEALLGNRVDEPMYDPTGNVTSERLVVSQRGVVGKSFRELCLWERFGVAATRLRRDGIEMTPRGELTLEPGDVLRVVGSRADITAVTAILGREERRLNETSIVPFAAGIVLGAVVGKIPISMPGGLQAHLGLAGGVFVVALLMGHLGGIGPVRAYVPHAVKYFARELGLYMFLAGVGVVAGQRFVATLMETGPSLIIAGALITLSTIAVAAVLMFLVLRWNLLQGAGALCACMTNPPGLAAAANLADSDAAAVGFASIYPIALIAKILFAPFIFLFLQR